MRRRLFRPRTLDISIGTRHRLPRAFAVLTVALLVTQFLVPNAAAPQASALVGIARLRDAWVQDLRNKRLEPVLKFYASDAVFLQPSGERLTGQTALRSLYQNVMSTFDSDLTLHPINTEISGDLAFDSGDYQEVLTTIATGGKINAQGNYVMIFKRQPGGSWLIIQHVWTGAPVSANSGSAK